MGHRQNARQLQALWKKWKEELHRNGSYAELKWTTLEDDCLRSAIEEIGATGDEGIYKADNGDENVARWVLVRDRLGMKNEECLGSIVWRWKYIESHRLGEASKIGRDSMDIEQNVEEGEQFSFPPFDSKSPTMLMDSQISRPRFISRDS